jgi:hypothetical protein
MTHKKPQFTLDDLGFMQIVSSAVLSAVARGELDLNLIARRELANRGLDRHGKWVGFEKASRLAEQMPVRRPNGKSVYVTVPENTPPNTAYVIRDNDGQYVRRFDVEHRAIILCDRIEVAKRFRTHRAANQFRRQHAGAGYGLSKDAAIVPIEIR